MLHVMRTLAEDEEVPSLPSGPTDTICWNMVIKFLKVLDAIG